MPLLQYTALFWLFAIVYRLFIASWRDTEADASISFLNMIATPLAAIFAFDFWLLLGNIFLFMFWGWAIDLVEDEEDENQISEPVDTTSTGSYGDSGTNGSASVDSGGSIDGTESTSSLSSTIDNDGYSESSFEGDDSGTDGTEIYDESRSESNDENPDTSIYQGGSSVSYCANCGSELDPGDQQRYCPSCGERLNQ